MEEDEEEQFTQIPTLWHGPTIIRFERTIYILRIKFTEKLRFILHCKEANAAVLITWSDCGRCHW